MSLNLEPAAKRASIYVRVSSTRQEEDGTSLETQEAACRQYAGRQGWSVAESHIYRETHKRWLLHERPQLTKLRDAAKSGEFDVVLCYCVDRLSSQDAHIYILDEEFERASVTLAFVTEAFEDTAIGRFVRSAKVLAAAIEVEKIRERTVRGRIKRVESGKLIPGGKPLYGYRWPEERDHAGRLVKGRLVEDPLTAPVVRRIFATMVQGDTLRHLARTLTDEGIPPPTGRGQRWHESTIAAMLHKPAYKGEAWGWGWRKGGTTPQTFDPSKAIRLPDGTIPSLVDAATWDAVQEILTRNKARAIRNARNPEAALLRGGYVRCGHCGRTMSTRPRSNGKVEYICRTGNHTLGSCVHPTMVTHTLDEAVWSRALGILTNPAVITEELAKRHGQDPTQEELATIDATLGRLERQQRVTAQAIASLEDADAAAPLTAQLQHLAAQKRTLHAEREQLVAQATVWAREQVDLERVEQWIGTVTAKVAQLTYQEKRLVLDALGFQASVYKADHTPRYVITADLSPDIVSSTSSGTAGWLSSPNSARRGSRELRQRNEGIEDRGQIGGRGGG